MNRDFLLQRLPRLYLVVLAAAWLVGVIDLIALVAEIGGGKGGALAVMFGPIALFGPMRARQLRVSAEWQRWAFALLLTGLSAPCLASLIYTWMTFGTPLHPNGFG